MTTTRNQTRTVLTLALVAMAALVLGTSPASAASIAGVDFENDANTAWDRTPDDLDPGDWITVSADWTNAGNLRNDNGANSAGAHDGAFPARLQNAASWSITVSKPVILDLTKIEFAARGATGSSGTPSGRRGDFGTSLDGGLDGSPLWSNTNLIGRPPWTPVSVDLSGATYQGLTNETVTFHWKGTSAIDLDTIVLSGAVRAADGGAIPALPSLATGDTVQVSNNHSAFDISVFPGKAAYDGYAGSGVFGDGTVLDYRFFDSPNDNINSAGYANGGAGLISEATSSPANTSGAGESWANLWTTNDPGTNFSGGDAPNFPDNVNTFARCADVTGTVDISGLVSGQLYFIQGSYVNNWTLQLTMTGDGVPDVIETHTVNPGGSPNKAWITDFTFDNAIFYDTISWRYTNTDSDGSRARFMGVILDGTAPSQIPEPMTILAVGLSITGLGGYIRRRRRA